MIASVNENCTAKSQAFEQYHCLCSVYVRNGTCSNAKDSAVQLAIKQKLSSPCHNYLHCLSPAFRLSALVGSAVSGVLTPDPWPLTPGNCIFHFVIIKYKLSICQMIIYIFDMKNRKPIWIKLVFITSFNK